MEDESPVSAAAVAKLAGAQRQQQQQRRQRREALEQKRDAMEQENDEDEEEEAVEDAQAPPPAFPPLPQRDAAAGGESNFARINVPPHRLTPLRENWMGICTPVAEQMKLLIRYNVEKKCVEMKTSEHTTVPNALQKASDFVRAFLLGFELRDAIAMLRIDDLYIDSFEVKDVKTLSGDALGRAVGRIAGIGGKTKFAIENATKTRIVLAEQRIHILGAYADILIAKDAIVRLIMGAPPGKVYTQMRNVAARKKERF